MGAIDLNVSPSNSPPFSSLKLHQPMVEMGQSDHANARVIQKSKTAITVAKKSAHGQESRYWWTPYAQSQLFEPNL
jgi:hypothetical protein